MSILFFWLERGGRWGWSPSTSPANYQKLNIIQKQAFNIFFTGEVWWTGFESIDLPGRSSEVKCNPKMSILFFWLERGGRWGSSSTTSPADHQRLNVIQKWAFIFWLERGSRWVLNRSTSPANHQKLNIIQKQAFNFFFTGEGWWTGFESIELPGQSSEVKCNPKMSILFFCWRGVADGVRVHRPAQANIRSWT